MTEELIEDLRCDAEMLKDGHQKNLTELWHSEVVKGAAIHCEKAAEALAAKDAVIKELVELLARYRNETPLGHQPHMIAHVVDEALAKAKEAKG